MRTEQTDMKEVLKQVALKNGVSEEEVREEMEKAIYEGIK